MTATELMNLTASGLIEKIKNHKGLSRFASERSKFEGWLKVELIDTLSRLDFDAAPEKDHIDVCFENSAIELKTINTNYRLEIVEEKKRPITKNVEGVVKDIRKLRTRKIENRFILFIVFPLSSENHQWKEHEQIITQELGGAGLVSQEFQFNNGVPGAIFCGRV